MVFPCLVAALTIVVNPSLPTWCESHDGVISVQRLDLDSVKVLSAILAQTVVLQYYEEVVDKLHEVVASLNTLVEKQDLKKIDAISLHRCDCLVHSRVLQRVLSRKQSLEFLPL